MSSEHDKRPPPPDTASAPSDAKQDLRDGMLKVFGAARRLVEELPTQSIEDFVLRNAETAKRVAKEQLPTDSPTYQRIEAAVVDGAREVGRALGNVTDAAVEAITGQRGSSAPPTPTDSTTADDASNPRRD